MMEAAPTAEAGPPPSLFSLLDEARATRLDLAAVRLRELQALTGAYAAMIEGCAFTIEDMLAVDAAFQVSAKRAGEALFTFSAALTCQGLA